jgi:two-component system OmpR family sensor kinase
MSLRTRLLLGLVALAAAGLLAADFATYSSLRSFLDERVTQQLSAARDPAMHELGEGSVQRAPRRGGGGRGGDLGPGPGRGGGPPDGGPSSFPAGTYAQLRSSDGTLIDDVWLGGSTGAEAPVFPADVDSGVFDADGYRVSAEPTSSGGRLLVAVPLTELRQTLARLAGIMLAVGLGVLVGLGLLAWWIVRVGLRPLERIGHTAADIAAGDLSKRVEPADERTEVGRLGLALNAMLAQIEQAFAERTASEERLRRFLADASHELRTPLTSIRGYAELFRRGASERPDDLAKSMQRIEQEAGRMGILVEDLLLLARLDQGRPLEKRAVDLADLASDAVADARAVDTSRTIALSSNGPVIVRGDETRLRQVLANLLTNALNHTPSGTPVEVSVAQRDGTASVSVADHGPGLPPQDAGRIFERFYRADRSRARETGGVGLGLSIVAAITKAHDGDVSVEPTPGGGATFHVRLPASAPA